MDLLPNNNVLVLGLGNTLLADDGVGVHVVRRLTADAATPPWVRAVDGGTMGFRLTSILANGGDVLIIDAADFSAAPGAIRLLHEEALADHVARVRKTSAHEAGLADLLGLLKLEASLPRRLAVLAIQPQNIDWGETLSGPVARAVGPACAMVKKTVIEWRREL
jgi:hydrogenase maturation protease